MIKDIKKVKAIIKHIRDCRQKQDKLLLQLEYYIWLQENGIDYKEIKLVIKPLNQWIVTLKDDSVKRIKITKDNLRYMELFNVR